MVKGTIVGSAALLALANCSLVFDSQTKASSDASIDQVIDAPIPDAPRPDSGIPSFSFPPANTMIKFVDGTVYDLNGDGIDDVILASAPSTGQPGVYVLLGPQSGPDLVYHHFIATLIAPTALTVGPGALGQSSGTSTIFVSGYMRTLSYVFHQDTQSFDVPGSVTYTSGNDPFAVIVGDFDGDAIDDDLRVGVGQGMHTFLSWAPGTDGAEIETGETFGKDLVGLIAVRGTDIDEYLVIKDDDQIIWRYINTLGQTVGAPYNGTCGNLLKAGQSDSLSAADTFVDIVAASLTHLCGYVLAGDRTMLDYLFEINGNIPAPAGGAFDDMDLVALSGAAAPELIVLDTDNLQPAVIHLLNDAAAVDGINRTLVPSSVKSRQLGSGNSPSFLLFPDFDNDDQKEIWAFDTRAANADCFRVDGTGAFESCL